MAGKTPYLAVKNFLAPLQSAVSCVSRAIIQHGGREYEVNAGPYALVVGGQRKLKRDPQLTLDIRMQYKIVEVSGVRGPYKVTMTAYMYIVDDHRGHEVFSYHWQPDAPEIKFPHLHVEHPTFKKAHFPTGRISLEEILRFLITDFGVEPLRPDWNTVLTKTHQRSLPPTGHGGRGNWKIGIRNSGNGVRVDLGDRLARFLAR